MTTQRPILISVIGPGDCDEKTYALSEQVGRELARRGATLVCGGLGGVMEGASRGARSVGGRTVGILPGSDYHEANPFIEIPIVTGLGEARNSVVVRTGRAVIAVGGEFGTLSEIAFALKFKIPVIGLGTWELGTAANIIRARDAAEAVELAFRMI